MPFLDQERSLSLHVQGEGRSEGKYYFCSEECEEGTGSFFTGSSVAAFMLSRKERIPLPRPWPSSGSFLGPKKITATARIRSRCCGCSSPSNMIILPICRGVTPTQPVSATLYRTGEAAMRLFTLPFSVKQRRLRHGRH